MSFSVDDGIELAPHRRSFRQGCHVSVTNVATDKPADKFNRPMFEKKSRLTGRASGQRKNLESNYRDHGDSSNGANYGDHENSKREKYADKEGRHGRFEKYSDKENLQPCKDSMSEKEKCDIGRDQRKEKDRENHMNDRKMKTNRHPRERDVSLFAHSSFCSRE